MLTLYERHRSGWKEVKEHSIFCKEFQICILKILMLDIGSISYLESFTKIGWKSIMYLNIHHWMNLT